MDFQTVDGMGNNLRASEDNSRVRPTRWRRFYLRGSLDHVQIPSPNTGVSLPTASSTRATIGRSQALPI